MALPDATTSSNVAEAAAGDQAAFARLVAEHHPSMARVAYAITGDRDTAEDAVQSAWSVAWRRLGSLRDPRVVRAWLVAIAANELGKCCGAADTHHRRPVECSGRHRWRGTRPIGFRPSILLACFAARSRRAEFLASASPPLDSTENRPRSGFRIRCNGTACRGDRATPIGSRHSMTRGRSKPILPMRTRVTSRGTDGSTRGDHATCGRDPAPGLASGWVSVGRSMRLVLIAGLLVAAAFAVAALAGRLISSRPGHLTPWYTR
jgi:DNA-directed RNA polymerase specialized sigma24 family protein